MLKYWGYHTYKNRWIHGLVKTDGFYVNFFYTNLLTHEVLKLNCFEETKKNTYIFYHFMTLLWYRYLKSFLMENRDLFIIHSHHCGCWWPGDTRSKGISSYSIDTVLSKYSGPRFNIKMTSYQYRKSHCGDKTILRSSYLHNGISYTGKMTSLYWIRAQASPLRRVKIYRIFLFDRFIVCIYELWMPINQLL